MPVGKRYFPMGKRGSVFTTANFLRKSSKEELLQVTSLLIDMIRFL